MNCQVNIQYLLNNLILKFHSNRSNVQYVKRLCFIGVRNKDSTKDSTKKEELLPLRLNKAASW